MKKLLFASLLLTSACDVDSRADVTTRAQAVCSGDDTAFCGAAMPARTKWDGKPLPATQGEAAVFIVADPQGAGPSWVVETDGDKVVAWAEFDARDTGRLITVLGTDGDPHTPILKFPRPLPPRDTDAAFYLALAFHDRAAQDAAAIACSGLPTGK